MLPHSALQHDGRAFVWIGGAAGGRGAPSNEQDSRRFEALRFGCIKDLLDPPKKPASGLGLGRPDQRSFSMESLFLNHPSFVIPIGFRKARVGLTQITAIRRDRSLDNTLYALCRAASAR